MQAENPKIQLHKRVGTGGEYYISTDNQYLIRREHRDEWGRCKWVLRDFGGVGNPLDVDVYRNDIFERNNMKVIVWEGMI